MKYKERVITAVDQIIDGKCVLTDVEDARKIIADVWIDTLRRFDNPLDGYDHADSVATEYAERFLIKSQKS